MPPSARPTNAVGLLLLGGVSLLGCPQLLDGDFSLASLPVGTGGTGPCPTPGCIFTSGDATVDGGGGTDPGTGGSAGAAGGSGASGNSGASGASGGTAGSGASGASSGAGGAPVDGDAGTTPDATVAPPDAGGEPDPPSCRIVTLNDDTHSSSDNCVGIHGWNDEQNGTGSSLTRTYQNGNVCLSGSISSAGYGAVYELTLANEGDWNANTYGVTGFDFEFTGSVPSGTLKVLYAANGDYCKTITPTGTVSVPFAMANPCSGGSSTPDVTQLRILQLNFGAGNYAVNFCVQIRAVP